MAIKTSSCADYVVILRKLSACLMPTNQRRPNCLLIGSGSSNFAIPLHPPQKTACGLRFHCVGQILC